MNKQLIHIVIPLYDDCIDVNINDIQIFNNMDKAQLYIQQFEYVELVTRELVNNLYTEKQMDDAYDKGYLDGEEADEFESYP